MTVSKYTRPSAGAAIRRLGAGFIGGVFERSYPRHSQVGGTKKKNAMGRAWCLLWHNSSTAW